MKIADEMIAYIIIDRFSSASTSYKNLHLEAFSMKGRSIARAPTRTNQKGSFFSFFHHPFFHFPEYVSSVMTLNHARSTNHNSSMLRTFGLSPPEFIQLGFHLLDHFSVPIPAPSPSPLLFLQFLLFSKTLVLAPPLFHLLAGLLTIFSQPEVAILHLFLTLGRVSFSG